MIPKEAYLKRHKQAEICECGHTIWCHDNGEDCKHCSNETLQPDCDCKKFTPVRYQNNKEVGTKVVPNVSWAEVMARGGKPQNNSPQGRKVGSATLDPAELKDKEPKDNGSILADGSDTQRGTSSLSDKIFVTWRTKVLYAKDVKEFVKLIYDMSCCDEYKEFIKEQTGSNLYAM